MTIINEEVAMSNRAHTVILSIAAIITPLLFTGMAFAQDPPSAAVEQGAFAYSNWTKTDAGGTGVLPVGVDSQDYIRCKACHG